MVGHAIHAGAVHDAWLMAIALSFEAFRANLSILDARVLEARPARGQVQVGATLRARLQGSALLESGAARRVQDPLSLRVVPQVHGALHWTLGEAREQIEIVVVQHLLARFALAEGVPQRTDTHRGIWSRARRH